MEHTIVVALTVTAPDRQTAEQLVVDALPDPRRCGADHWVESWWIAEDDRHDGSDCDSAVFCKPGNQQRATDLLRAAELAS